ncbi:DUF2332 domain-containing protein [Intrasporangium sp. DVR]|uniref:DUF2332 domain-containing protein n=1 Tax=Intrasporangium sp. DVR TaxID=3127867 RepID=UPI00313A5A97
MNDGDGRLATIQRRFADFAREYAHLPLYGALARRLAEDDETARLLLAAAPGQDRPVLWLAALHDLVLAEPSLPAARWFASVVGRDAVPQGDPWPDVRSTVLAHRRTLMSVIASRSIQTNEVNRCVYVAAGLVAATADRPDDRTEGVALVELGASAGLLLGVDRYAIELTRDRRVTVGGDPGSPVRCRGVDRSPVPVRVEAMPRVTGRAGVDRSPVHLGREADVRWLRACLWPDVPGRVERFEAALPLAARHPAPLLEGDLVDRVGEVVDVARAGSASAEHVVVYSSWALTYVESSRRAALAERLTALGRDLPALSWLTAEPPGAAPGIAATRGPREGSGEGSGETVLGLRRWRAGAEVEPLVLGTCHPHGEWIDLSPAPVASTS